MFILVDRPMLKRVSTDAILNRPDALNAVSRALVSTSTIGTLEAEWPLF